MKKKKNVMTRLRSQERPHFKHIVNLLESFSALCIVKLYNDTDVYFTLGVICIKLEKVIVKKIVNKIGT